MKKYFIFGSRATNALWEDDNDMEAVIKALDDFEAELFIFDPQSTPVHEVLNAYSKWNEFSYLTTEQYEQIMKQV